MSKPIDKTQTQSLIMVSILILIASCAEEGMAKAKAKNNNHRRPAVHATRNPAALMECGFKRVSKEVRKKRGQVNVEIYSLYSPNPLHVVSASVQEVIAKKSLVIESSTFTKIKANQNSLPYYIKLRDRESGEALAQSKSCSVKN